ncbi:MAG: DNA polymerase I [Bacteroidota bacterium]
MSEPTLFDALDTPPVPARLDDPSEGDAPEEAEATPEADAPEATDESAERETLFLADALALAYRAFFSMKNAVMNAPDGTDTRTLYGFSTALLKLLEDHQPEQIAVVFDAIGPGGTFRDELYEEYKAHRPPMPEEIKDCIPLIKDLCRGFDIPVLEMDGYEADDVIGTLCRRAEEEGVDVVIFSADKDFRQLLSDEETGAGPGCVQMLRPPYMGEVFSRETAETFREKYDGLEPVQFIELLALMGDTADNVPGVPGIGEKTAVKLIKQYGTIENLIEHRDEVKGKRASDGLANHSEDAILSKKLVTIATDIDLTDDLGLPLDWHSLRRTDPDMGALNHLFDHVGFGQRLRTRAKDYAEGRERTRGPSRTRTTTLPETDPSLDFDFGPYEPVTAMDESDVDYTTIYEQADLGRAVAEAEGEPLAFDTETTSVDAMQASLVGVALSSKEKRAVYLPTPIPDGTRTETALDAIRARLEDPAVPKVGHNVKYDLLVLKNHGVDVRGPFFDTMVAHYLVNPEASHKMDDVASFYLNYRPQPITDLIGTGKNALSMRDVPVEDVGPYACEDADVTLQLVAPLREKLEADGLLAIAEEIEFPLIPVLARMEFAGVKVDPKILDGISVQLEEEMTRLEAQIVEIAGREFNIGSPKQLGEVLFNPPPTDEEREAAKVWAEEVKDPKAAGKTKKQLKEEAPTFGIGLEPLDKTSSGAPSTAEKVLNELSLEHTLPALVLDWRKLSKLKSTYADKLPELIHPTTGRIHTDFNQTVAATGRLSSSNPNLQNIPIRTEQGREIRRAFIAENGFKLLAADYAQIELRLIAHMSQDPELLEAFRQGRDIHTATAARVFGVDYDDVNRTQRSQVKQVNYGIPYGVSAFGLAYRMRIKNSEAQALIDQYRASYPAVIQFLDELVRDARERGYAETLLGRRRYLPNLGARNPNDRAFAERVAVNMPIQGTQADMIKRAMVAIDARLGEVSERARMILQVHDELVFEVPEADVEAVSTFVREEMVVALPLDVPVVVDVGVADNWLDAH